MRKGIVLVIFIIIVVSCTFAACSPPVGNIGGAGDGFSGSGTEDFFVVPRRQVYNVLDYFVCADDLWVFAQGRMINTQDVTISMVTNPDSSLEYRNEPLIIDTGERWLDFTIGKGRKLIMVTYRNETAEYSIEVQDPYGLLSDDEGDGDNGPPPIGVIWD